jgi:hypothetical protein
MAKPTCKACGGTIHGSHCLLCELFQTSQVPDGHRSACWPKKSFALAVHPKQVPEQMAHAKRMGVPTDFDSTGKPILTSRGHRAEYTRLVDGRRVDYDGGYSDCTESQAARDAR